MYHRYIVSYQAKYSSEPYLAILTLIMYIPYS
jgi:hypothetical protein